MMAVYAVRMDRNSEPNDRDSSCYIYQRDGCLFHTHKHESGWNESQFTLETLDHHLTMYRKGTFFATKSDLPDFILGQLDGDQQ